MDLAAFFNIQPRTGLLGTADSRGQPNLAVIGSARMLKADTVEMDIGKGRSLDNLATNPRASYVVIHPGPTMADWQGVRLQLELRETHRSGEKLEQARAALESRIGKAAARRIKATLVFALIEARPLVDLGQAWDFGME